MTTITSGSQFSRLTPMRNNTLAEALRQAATEGGVPNLRSNSTASQPQALRQMQQRTSQIFENQLQGAANAQRHSRHTAAFAAHMQQRALQQSEMSSNINNITNPVRNLLASTIKR